MHFSVDVRAVFSSRSLHGRVLALINGGLVLQKSQTQVATPASFWRVCHGRAEAVHVVSSVTVITEQKLVVVLRCATNIAALALNALPAVSLHSCHHHGSELQA